MKPYGLPREDRSGYLRLDFNENTVGCAPSVRKALAGMGRSRTATYPDARRARAAVSRSLRVREEEMVLTAGTDDGLRLIVDAFARRGQQILTMDPTFDMYRFYGQRAGIRVRKVRYARDMSLPLDKVKRALAAGPKIFFLANPSNPTGTLVDRETIGEILGAARRTLVVIDEAYFEFAGVTVLPWIRRRRNLVVARTFSKAAGLAGLRVGVLCARKEISSKLRALQSPFPVTAPALVAAEAACADPGYVERYAREVKASRALLRDGLERLGAASFPSGGNFVLADFGPRVDGVIAGLRDRGILIRDRRDDFRRPGFTRITVGTRSQTRRLLKALGEILR